MPDSSVFLFWGIHLVIPESVSDDEAPLGVPRETADSTFGVLDYYAVPSLEPDGSPEDKACCFLFDDDTKLPPLWRAVAIRALLPRMSDDSAGRLLRAYHVIQWRRDSKYCGSCGNQNGDSPDELARLCPRCGRIEYPRISPAVIVLITNGGDKVLLAHNKKFKDKMYSLIAGFVESGESLESAVNREIKEELDIEVTDARYIKSQSWPFPNAIMLGFTARFTRGTIKPDGAEIIDARWFSRETIRRSSEGNHGTVCPPGSNAVTGGTGCCEFDAPDLPAQGSISRYLIDRWLAEKTT